MQSKYIVYKTHHGDVKDGNHTTCGINNYEGEIDNDWKNVNCKQCISRQTKMKSAKKKKNKSDEFFSFSKKDYL